MLGKSFTEWVESGISNLYLVDSFTDFKSWAVSPGYLYSLADVYPNNLGYDFIGSVWYNGITNYATNECDLGEIYCIDSYEPSESPTGKITVGSNWFYIATGCGDGCMNMVHGIGTIDNINMYKSAGVTAHYTNGLQTESVVVTLDELSEATSGELSIRWTDLTSWGFGQGTIRVVVDPTPTVPSDSTTFAIDQDASSCANCNTWYQLTNPADGSHGRWTMYPNATITFTSNVSELFGFGLINIDGVKFDTRTYCTVDETCSDGLFCTGTETCVENLCVSDPNPCPHDGLTCNGLDSCNETSDVCVHSGNPCDNEVWCDGTELCDEVSGCSDGEDPDCDDGFSCTTDECNEGTDSCDHTPDDDVCDDTLYCNGTETCDVDLGCVAGTSIDCDDSVDCTTDECNEDTDSCDNTPDDEVCDDDLACNGDETCDEVEGCLSGTSVDCDDSVECTDDSCTEDPDLEEGTDYTCVNAANDSNCDDDIYCNGDETCDEVLGCQSGDVPCPDDSIYCNGTEGCDEENDQCTHTGDPCPDDSTYCNGTESCNEDTDSCDHSGDPCVEDSIFCNGVEYCDEGLESCLSPGNPCDDEDSCTDNFCQEETDSCNNPCNATSQSDPCCSESEHVCETDIICTGNVPETSVVIFE